ncbi:MAG: S41 family peptidase [Flavipsychrobacter sp.]|nr:S41 family peptidase [Flavipsychrobacter sp.]
MKLFVNVILALFIATMLSGCNTHSTNKDNISTKAPKDTAANNLPVKSMRDDLFILWSAIKEMHPGYGIYTTTDSLQKAYDKTYAAINTPLTETQFITLIYPFLCNLRCGHTQIMHAEGYKSPANIKLPHLPFAVLVRNHCAWVTMNQTKQLNTGDELISINGVPVSTIIDHGYGMYCGDGYNETFKELYLSEYDGFEDVCNKYYHWPGPYVVKFISQSAIVKTVQIDAAKSEVNGDSAIRQVNNYANWVVASGIPDSRLRFLNNSSVALFKSTPFAYSDTDVFKDAFKLIKQKGVKTLILDMRHNTGGDLRVATCLLSYLADAPFRIVADVKSRIPNPAVNSFTRYFDSSATQGFILGFNPTDKEGSWYHIEAKPAFGNLYGPFPLNKEDHFDGKLLVLIDGATFSSGTLFSAAVKAQRKKVVFIGRETAGAEEGCNGVTIQKLTLPNTKIIVQFPWMRVVSVAKHPIAGHGIMPDYPVNHGPYDIVTNKDLDLIKALTLVN